MVPEAQFGFAAGLEAGVLLSAGVIPAEELLACFGDMAGVEFAQQRGLGQADLAQIKDKVNERIELALGELPLDETFDGLLRFANVVVKNSGALGLGDAVAEGLRVDEAMAVADGGVALDVEIDAVAKAFRFFDQFHACRAQFHVSSNGCPYDNDDRKLELNCNAVGRDS